MIDIISLIRGERPSTYKWLRAKIIEEIKRREFNRELESNPWKKWFMEPPVMNRLNLHLYTDENLKDGLEEVEHLISETNTRS